MARPSSLSEPSQDMVLKVLRKNKLPLSAYAILEKLKKSGIKSPPIVYRALENLIKNGRVHRINELNAFVACNCESDHTHDISVLTVCSTCKKVEELHDHAIIQHLGKLRQMDISLAEHAVIELPVTCAQCQKSA